MKTTNRVHKNGATKPASSQAIKITPAAPSSELKIAANLSDPARLNASLPDLCKQAADSFDELQKSGAGAVALAMITADTIKQSVGANVGWEDLDCALFQFGNCELPQFFARQFHREFSAWLADLDRLVTLCKRGETLADNDIVYHNNIENAVNALKHFVEIQGATMSDRKHNSSFACSFLVVEHLGSAFEKAWKDFYTLVRAARVREFPQAA